MLGINKPLKKIKYALILHFLFGLLQQHLREYYVFYAECLSILQQKILDKIIFLHIKFAHSHIKLLMQSLIH